MDELIKEWLLVDELMDKNYEERLLKQIPYQEFHHHFPNHQKLIDRSQEIEKQIAVKLGYRAYLYKDIVIAIDHERDVVRTYDLYKEK